MIPYLPPNAPPHRFPPVERALRDPDGLLCCGGDLEPIRLLAAYRRGIFPWYSDGEPILWWSPDPRTIIVPAQVHVARRLARDLHRVRPEIRFDGDFASVIRRCAAPRPRQSGTWITREMAQAYRRLHELGHAHCAEAFIDGQRVGGIYGLAIGRAFFGESMFSEQTNGSKMALVGLCRALDRAGFELLDCQVESAHLSTMGARTIARAEFVAQVARLVDQPDAWSKIINYRLAG